MFLHNSGRLASISKFALSLLAILCFGCSSRDKEPKKEKYGPPLTEGMYMLTLLPVQLSNWKQEETTIIEAPEDIIKYMDSRGRLYMTYGFKMIALGKYRNRRNLPMLVEICKFDSSENAYGAYSFDTVGEKLDIGQDAVYGYGVLKFWKNRMLVRIIAEEEYQQLEDDIVEFGKEIGSKIVTTGHKPKILSLVPEEDIVPDSLHFFHENLCLNNVCYIPESIELDLSPQTNAVTAQYYLNKEQPPRLILVEYPDGAAAKVAFGKFGTSYFNGEPVSPDVKINVARMAEGEYSSITLSGDYIVIVLEAQNPDLCNKLVALTLSKIELRGKSGK